MGSKAPFLQLFLHTEILMPAPRFMEVIEILYVLNSIEQSQALETSFIQRFREKKVCAHFLFKLEN